MRPLLLQLLLLLLCVQPSYGRDAGVVREFKKLHPCPVEGPGTCASKGYQIDHVDALVCGGPDRVENLVYLNRESHKLKSRDDVRRCRGTAYGFIMRALRAVIFWE